jgi:Fe-Mn family superoxide dismutase
MDAQTQVAGTSVGAVPKAKNATPVFGEPEHAPIFHNAAQAWNHAFYWRSLSPRGLLPAPRPESAR